MEPVVLTGSKRDIADAIMRLAGDTLEVIVFVEDPTRIEKLRLWRERLAGMRHLMAHAGNADFSREAIYSPMPGEYPDEEAGPVFEPDGRRG